MYCNCETRKIIRCIAAFLVVIFVIVVIFAIVAINNNEQKSILTAIAEEGDNTQLGTTNIKFSQNDIVVGNALTHEEGTDSININETGIYQISYQLFGIKDGAGSFNFNAVLTVNGNPIENTFNDGPVIEDLVNNRITLTSTVILRLNEGNVLRLVGASIEDIRYEKARIDIEKID